ncbi:hypothetical protein LG336_19190 [Mesobacillus maritimus]
MRSECSFCASKGHWSTDCM